MFNSFEVELNTSNKLLLNLIYNLSRTEVESESSLKKQITILRDIQLSKLPIDSCRNKNQVNTLKSNQDKLRELDFGFKIPKFRTNVYPFSSNTYMYFSDFSLEKPNFITREYICKFVCETDTQYVFEKGGAVRTDFRATNKLGLSRRYLFKDRNMAIHDCKHVSVQNLLEPKYVDNLLYFLGDARVFLNNLQFKDGSTAELCVITYLKNKTNKLYELVIKKTNEVIKEKNLSDDVNLFEKTAASVKEILKEEYNYNNFLLIYDKKLLIKLEMYLNDMFAVNEKNEYGDSDNILYRDFFREYHSEIALYTTYLTFALDKE